MGVWGVGVFDYFIVYYGEYCVVVEVLVYCCCNYFLFCVVFSGGYLMRIRIGFWCIVLVVVLFFMLYVEENVIVDGGGM